MKSRLRSASYIQAALCVCGLSWSSGAFSLQDGRSDWKWLNLATDARSFSLSQQGAVLFTSDTTSQVNFSNFLLPTEFGGGIQSLQFWKSSQDFLWTAGGQRLLQEDFEGKDEFAQSTGNFDVAAWDLFFGTVWNKKQWALGTTLNYGQYHIENGISRALWMNFFAQYQIFQFLKISSQLRQIGGGEGFYKRELHLPSTANLGVQYDFSISQEQLLSSILSVNYENDGGVHTPVGFEWSFNKLLFLRASNPLRTADLWESVLGAGLSWKWMSFDYAYQFHPELGGYQQMTLKLTF